MDQVSRPLQIVLILALAFAGLWFVALRPKSESSSAPAPAPSPAAPAPAQGGTSPPANGAQPGKSALPGGLGRAVDKARATKAQGDAAAARADAGGSQNAPATPAQRLAANSNGVVAAGGVALGMFTTALQRAVGDFAAARTGGAAPRQVVRAGARSSRTGASPGKVRLALARGHAVVLLFYNARASDDRAVRGELAQVGRRGGKVDVWAVSIRGLPRFKSVLGQTQVLQSPTVVVLDRGSDPVLFPGFTDHAELDQAAAVALRR